MNRADSDKNTVMRMNANPVLVKENMRKHNPDSPFLIGGYMPGDIVREAIQKSWIDGQIRLEF